MASVTVVVFALGAALCNALASIFQRNAARSAPDEDSLRLELVAYLLHRPAWFAGIVAMTASFLLQAAALARGQLSAVQPLLVSELLFVLAILAFWFHLPLGRRAWTGAVLIVVGLAGFLAVASPAGGGAVPSPLALALAGLATTAVVGAALVLSRGGSSAGRAALFGGAAGATFALTAVLTKLFTEAILAHGLVGAFLGWTPYAVGLTGVGAVFLAENAFQAGPLTASQPALTIVDPLVSVILGIALFGDRLQATPWAIGLELVTFAIMAVGIVLLTRAPHFAGVDRAETPTGTFEEGAEPTRPPTPEAATGDGRFPRVSRASGIDDPLPS